MNEMKKKRFSWQLIVLALTSFLLYSNTLSNGFVLDDDVVFLQNRYVQEGVTAIDDILGHGFLYGFNQRNDQSYRPLVLINFAIEKSIFGNDPKALHFFNLLYFSILVCLLFLLFKRLLPHLSIWIPFWIAALYAFHPIHTEVVANIKGRDEILHAIFAVLSLIYALKFFDDKKNNYLAFSLLAFFLALLCKEMAVTLIALIPLSVYFFREVKLSILFKRTLPYLGILVVYLLIRSLVLEDITFAEDMSMINNTLAGASSMADRLATNLLIFANYIKLLFFPHPLSWDYSYPHFPIVGFTHPVVILTFVLLLLLFAFSVKGLMQKNPYAFAFLFFVISFSVVSNFFILIGATLGERFLFFPSIAFCFFLVYLIKDLDLHFFARKRKYGIPLLVLVLILLPYAAKTIDRNAEWESNETLFTSGVNASPNNSRSVSALASIYRTRGETAQNERDKIVNLEKAKELYLESIRLYRDNADALYNLGVVYNNLGNREKARLAYERVLEISPRHLNALNNIGVIYFQMSDFNRAEYYFTEALKVQSNFANAHANLGAVYHNRGEFDKAKAYYERALQLNPQDINSRNNLNLLLNR